MSKVNKFQIDWQMARLRARGEKDVEKKIQIIVDFIERYPSKDNQVRVLNWVRMTGLAYKDPALKAPFLRVYEELVGKEYKDVDYGNELGRYSISELNSLIKDLESRKYNFQFGGKAPEDHVKFMRMLNNRVEFFEA